MGIELLRTLHHYGTWATGLVLDRAASLDEAALHAPSDVPRGTLFETLAHTYAAEHVWRVRCEAGRSPKRLPAGADFGSLAELAAAWRTEQAAMRAYLARLTDKELEENVEYRRTDGTPFRQPLWEVLLHLANHGTQHRSEAALLLTRFGRSPGDLDLIRYFREGRTG